MKKLLLICFCVATMAGLHAQPVLDQTAVGAVGSTFYLGIQDTFPNGFSIGSAGANQTWNFDSLWVNDTDTVWFVSPSGTTYGANFPTANLTIKQASLGDGEAFLQSSSNALDLLGVAADLLNNGNPVVVHQNPPLRVAQFPFTYLDSYNNTTVIDVTVDASTFGIPFVDSARYKNIQDRDAIADAWGTLALPAATFSNVLRVKEVNAQTDSIWVHSFFGWTLYQDSSYTDSTFTWWNGSKGYFLAQATYSGPDLNRITYEDPVIVGEPRPVDRIFTVYPNPAQDQLTILSDGKSYALEVYDVQGRMVKQARLHALRQTVAVGDLLPGIYIYRLRSERGAVLESGRLSIAR